MDLKGNKELMDKLSGFNLSCLDDIRQIEKIMSALRFDVTPRQIMEPHRDTQGKDFSGYMFYIEAFDDPPQLMLMKINKSGVMTTVAKVGEVPPEMLRKAIEAPADTPTNKMYAIDEGLEEWLRKGLGL